MTNLIPAELLEKGAAYIEEHGLWQGTFWPETVVASHCSEPSWLAAQRQGAPVCAMGSLQIAAQGDAWASRAGIRLSTYLGGAVPPWNDTPGRTAAEVADAMRACATGLRGES